MNNNEEYVIITIDDLYELYQKIKIIEEMKQENKEIQKQNNENRQKIKKLLQTNDDIEYEIKIIEKENEKLQNKIHLLNLNEKENKNNFKKEIKKIENNEIKKIKEIPTHLTVENYEFYLNKLKINNLNLNNYNKTQTMFGEQNCYKITIYYNNIINIFINLLENKDYHFKLFKNSLIVKVEFIFKQ